jgi:hypothetical protein
MFVFHCPLSNQSGLVIVELCGRASTISRMMRLLSVNKQPARGGHKLCSFSICLRKNRSTTTKIGSTRIQAFSNSREGLLAFHFTESDYRRLRSAADAIALPQTEPRAMGEHLIVPPIGSRNVRCAQRSAVRHCQDALKPLDLGNDSFNFHSHQYIEWASQPCKPKLGRPRRRDNERQAQKSGSPCETKRMQIMVRSNLFKDTAMKYQDELANQSSFHAEQ